MDELTSHKWDRAAESYDRFNSGAERRWADYKREHFSAMSGDVLFVALGTGLDIQFFPPGRRLTAIDISEKMIAQARPRVEAYDGEIDVRRMDVRSLEFPDDSFDQVYTSCTFCSVPDPVAGLRELRRVLRPGGVLRMFEHTGSRWFPFSLMLHLMTPLTRKLGPEMNRNTVANVQRAGLRIVRVRNLYLDVLKIIWAEKEPLAAGK